jgi:hypothetical protein
VVGAELIEMLRGRRLVSVFGRKSAVRVAQAWRTTDLGGDWEARLLDLVRRKTGLVRPGLLSGLAGELLDELGLATIEPQALVPRITVPTTSRPAAC